MKNNRTHDQQTLSSGNAKNWAFTDLQNLLQGIKPKGWKIDWFKLREYLRVHHNVSEAFMFLGHVPWNERLYRIMERANFRLEFRPVTILNDGTVDGGNVDADLASFVMDYKSNYTKAVIIGDDGDYFRTVRSLNMQNKLACVVSSHSIKKTSNLIKSVLQRDQLISVHNLQTIIEK